MALRIGICDDCQEQIDLVKRYIEDFPGEEAFDMIVSTKPEAFLWKLETAKPQIVFLDIDMDEMNGIELGNRIKALDGDAVVIYITAHEKYALDAFKVRAFHYLLKPVTAEKFRCVFAEALELVGKRAAKHPAKVFSILTRSEMISVCYDEIYYFEKTGHKIKVHTESRDISYYDNISDLTGRIDGNRFIQCHQGFIVNAEKIRGFRDKMLYLDGGRVVPVSRSYIDCIKEMLARRLFADGDNR